ncbi:MAG: 6-phospho-3-hexuloisomerase [Candidatus Bathyarchaeota archaeon]|nr:6-phospho-3-hexuloisomerase [Candidatus Bathyarchaeota archaeon]
MEFWVQAYEELLSGISMALRELDQNQISGVIQTLIDVRTRGSKIMIVGAGRSGLVGKAFAMRLMHLGFNVYVLGETITPNVGEGDLVLVISGSGSTTLPLMVAEKAKTLGAFVQAVTSQSKSPLARTSDGVVLLPGREIMGAEEEYISRQLSGEHESLAPMGTIFEDTCMIFLDSIIAELMNRLGATEEVMKKRHATIE